MAEKRTRGGHNRKDLSGRRYGKFTVIKAVGRVIRGINRPRPLITYECLCDCGTVKIIAGQDLQHSRTSSCGCSRKKLDDDQNARAVWHNYLHRAKVSGKAFTFTKDEFYATIVQPCFYCGIPPANLSLNKYNKTSFSYNGLDRRDNLEGYTSENSVPCCADCNRAKRKMTEEEFLNLVKRIYHNRIAKG